MTSVSSIERAVVASETDSSFPFKRESFRDSSFLLFESDVEAEAQDDSSRSIAMAI